MTDFTIHTIDSAPEASKEMLEGSKKAFGFVPNLHAGLAEAPAALKAYKQLSETVGETGFTPEERNVAWLEINRYHECHYCMAAHTGIAKSEGVSDDVIEAARTGAPYPSDKLNALRAFTKTALDTRGWADDQAVDAFLGAGFEKRHVFDLIAILAHKTISNYANHLLDTPVDSVFERFAWSKDAPKAAE